MSSGPADTAAVDPRAPDPVAAAVRAWLAAGYVPDTAPLLVACSGGADSLALAVATRAVAAGRELAAATVDHRLQPGSEQVARRTAEMLRALGYPTVETVTVTVGDTGGMEAAARTARYAALADLAARLGPGTAVLLAHTADDQAETVLLGLARGSGPRSVAGMRPWRTPWGRPLLGIRRAGTEKLCRDAGLTPWSDPQNTDPAFTRVRLRHEVLPLLDDVLGGGVRSALARTAELMADDLDALDEIAARTVAEAQDAAGDLECSVLAARPSAVRRRALRSWVAHRTGVTSLTFQHLVRLENIVIHGRERSAVRIEGGTDIVRAGPVLSARRADGRLGA